MEETSLTLILSGKSSILESFYFPIELIHKKQYVLGLIELLTFNSIRNIDESCYTLEIGEHFIKFSTSSYEIEDIDE